MSAATLERDLGTQIVEALHREWQVDDEWCEWSGRGFAWWGHRLRQRVWAEPGFDDDGITVFRICAVTDFLNRAAESDRLTQSLALLSRFSALAALVHEPGTGKVSLFTSVYAHEETAAWVGRLLSHAAILQPIEAEARAEATGELLGGQAAWSAHPASGPRPAPDEMLGVVDQLYAPHGQGPSAWADTEEFEQAAEMLNQGNCFATPGRDGLTAEFAFGQGRTSMLRALSDQVHPQLGSGLILQLHLPLSLERPEAARLAAALNRLEAAGRLRVPALGGWTTDDLGGGAHPVFVTFVPTVMHERGLLTNLALYSASRAVHVGELLSEGEGGDAVEIIARRWTGFGDEENRGATR